LQWLQKVWNRDHKVLYLALIFILIMLIVGRIDFNDSELQSILATRWSQFFVWIDSNPEKNTAWL
jgi:hypothetical protein